MRYYTIQPSQKLADYVRFFWVLESDETTDTPYIYRSLADGFAELLFHYQGTFDELISPERIEKSFISGVHGQSQKYRRFITTGDFGIFGAYLYPSAIPQFFSLPSSELSNQMPDLRTLLGNEGGYLEERMMLAPDNLQRVKIISAFLETALSKRFIRPPDVFSCINYIIQSKGVTDVAVMASKYFLSTRQFERKFKQFSGFSPKLFSRIVRFQSAINNYGNKNISLTEIAYECGYYDQSHFIHDFREFSGYNPKQYFSGNAEGVEYREV
ncbi:MAG: helix-turn-helix domain-containing protein [Chitinophagaceae bacterium]